MVTLTEHETYLEIAPDDLEALADARDLCEAMEEPLCNGWDWIRPEEVGALTDGMLITNDCARDDEGKLTYCGRIFWDSEYQVQDTLDELRAGRSVQWMLGEG